MELIMGEKGMNRITLVRWQKGKVLSKQGETMFITGITKAFPLLPHLPKRPSHKFLFLRDQSISLTGLGYLETMHICVF